MSQFPAGVKPRAPIFTFDAVSDSRYMKTSSAHKFDPEHPLMADEDRLKRILNVMYAKINKTLFPWSKPGRRSGSEAGQSNNADDPEWILEGTGVSADDVLSEAFEGLLLYPPERLLGTWEGLAVTIAENKATDALRAAGKGLRGTEHRTALHLVSGDLEREGPDGETEPAIFDTLPSNWGDPEAEFFVLDDVLKLRNLAREVLDDRDLGIFFALHFDGDSRKEVGDRFGLTGQRVGQIYHSALSTLEAHPDYPFKPPMEVEQISNEEEPMTSQSDPLSKFRDAFLDYLEGHRDNLPAVEDLPDEQRAAAEAFVKSITAARGVDPYASRPSVEQLLARRSQPYDRTGELGEVLEKHLRLTVDPKASVIPDAASVAFGLASTSVILARGMRMRVVPEMNSADLDYALAERAEDIARVFSAFPDSHAVLYATTGIERLGVVVDRGDVHRAIETPSGERRAPRLRRSISDATNACQEWLTDTIPYFEPLSIDLLEPTAASESALNPYRLASQVVDEVSTSGARARIEAKRATWRGFGDQEAQCLAAIVQEAQLGRLSEESYESHLNELVGIAA